MKNQYSNGHENMNLNDTMHEGRFFEYLYNLREENPWDEKDFNSVFMYL